MESVGRHEVLDQDSEIERHITSIRYITKTTQHRMDLVMYLSMEVMLDLCFGHMNLSTHYGLDPKELTKDIFTVQTFNNM